VQVEMLAQQDPLVPSVVLVAMEPLVAILFWLVNQVPLLQPVVDMELRLILEPVVVDLVGLAVVLVVIAEV